MDLLALHLIHQLNVTSPKLPLGMTSPAPQVSLVPPSTAAESLFGTLPFTKAPLLGESPPSPAPSFWQIVRQQVSGPSRFVIRAVSRLWQGVMDRYQDPNLGVVGDLEDLLDDETVQHYVISPDAAQLHLASTDFLEHIPQQNPDTYQPDAGVRFNDDGSVTFRVLVGNTHDRLTLVGDFNNWGNVWNTASYQLFPTPNDPLIHEVTLPPGDYHLNQYRLRDQYGHDRIDLSADLFSTPAFNQRFYGSRTDDNLNAVIWKPTPIPAEEVAERPDLRGQPMVIAETDMVSLSLNWVCDNPDSEMYGTKGSDNITYLYDFVGECGLPEQMAKMGYNAVEFMPLDTHVDFWTPDSPYFPDWRFTYQTINYYGKHADFGSPDELRQMINDFHKAGVAVILDVVYSHYSNDGNEPPRNFGGLGFAQYHSEDGWELYGGPWTEWGTRRFTYSPAIRHNIVDAALKNILIYGFDGLRIDNVNGIDAQPYGRELLKEISQSVMDYWPEAIVIGEGYFGDPYLNRSVSIGGGGMATTYSDRFYLWFTEQIIKHREEIDTWKLDYMLKNDWPRTLLYYPGNHDEFANPGNPFQTRGRYLVEAINGGEFHNRKVLPWSALALFASSYYLDMPQLWTMQPGNLNSNSAIEWFRLEDPFVTQVSDFQADMKGFYIGNEAFAPHNVHHHMVHWMDHDNKVVTFERIDFATGRHTYALVNLGDEAIDHYRIPVSVDNGTNFAIALDSDRIEYGGNGFNGHGLKSQDGQLEFYLPPYAVMGFVQQDNLVIPTTGVGEIPNPDYPRCNGYYYYCRYGAYGAR
jgi:1,4-alpha-glucan branching enzyme